MKKYYLTVLLCFLYASCTMRYRNNFILWYNNYTVQETLNIETDFPFLTENQFNQFVFDTTEMHRLDSNSSMQLIKAINRARHEISVELGNETYIQLTPHGQIFFIYGKLNLYPNIISLAILNVSPNKVDDHYVHALMLFNLKDNQLCSIVFLDLFHELTKYPNRMGELSIENKIFTRTCKENNSNLSYDIFGFKFRERNRISFSTFTIDKNGFLKFTKD